MAASPPPHHHQPALISRKRCYLIRTRFAYRFLRALMKLNHRRQTLSTFNPRYRSVRRAADLALASAAGRERAWSRAKLLNIHSRRGRAIADAEDGRRSPTGDQVTAEELRRLVPGGEVMDMRSLLDETAHYLSCLMAQVQIMRNMADVLSSINS